MKVQCLGCRRQRELAEFHGIPDVVAFKSVQNSIVRTSATSGQMDIPGRFSTGCGTFIWCTECDASLDMTEKKKLIWRLCTHSYDEADALANLERARHLCAQIERGL